MKIKIIFLTFVFFVSYARGQLAPHGSIKVTESQFANNYILGIKKLQVGNATHDDVVKEIGNPTSDEKTINNQTWNYSFDVISDKIQNDIININNLINLNTAGINKISRDINSIYTDYDSKIRNTHNMWLEKKYSDDMKIKITGNLYESRENLIKIKIKEKNSMINSVQGLQQKKKSIEAIKPQKICCFIKFSSDGVMSGICVEKYSDNGKEVIYQRSDTKTDSSSDLSIQNEQKDFKNKSEILALSVVPSDPKPGQLYFNSTDSHFYGWNGKEWKQLDN